MRLLFSIRQTICFILLWSIFAGCAKQLDMVPKDRIPQSLLGESDINKLRLGLYSRMEDLVFQYWYDFDVRGGNFKGGPGTSLVDPVNISAIDPLVQNLWSGAYATLSRVNFLIETVNDLGTNVSPLNLTAKSDALFFRALIYYNLVTRWGGVPVLLEQTYEAIQRSTEQEVWAQIKKDLQDAEPIASDFTNRFYVSKQAIQSLQARVFLATGEKENAATAAGKVIGSGKFSLANDAEGFATNFISGSTSKELVFALANNTTGNFHLFYQSVNDVDGSWPYSASDDAFNNLYEDDALKSGDIRETAVFSSSFPSRIIKFPNGVNGQQLIATPDRNSTPINVFRISELYLVKAEAEGATVGSSTLVPYFEARYATTPDPTTIASLTASDYLDLILNERRREFFAEGQNWFDYKRTGRTDLLPNLNGRNYLLYYPIPQNEKDLGGYTQNEGY